MRRNMLKAAVVWSILVVVSVVGIVLTKSVVFIVALIILAAVAFGWAICYMHNYMKNLDTSSDFKIKAQTSFVRLSTADAEGYVEKAKSDEVRECCKKVYEALRYSDPMSTEHLEEIERQISTRMFALGEAVASDDIEQAKIVSGEIVELIGDRERLCKAIK